MAGPGTYTAYRQLRPLEGDISQDIQQQQENLFKRDAIEEQRAKNKADAEAKVKEQKQKELDKVKYPVNPDVKVQTLTDYGAKTLRMAANRIGEISSKLYGNKKLLPEEDEDELRLELNNLQNTPELLKNSASALTTQSEDYRKRLAEGKIRPNLKFETFINNGATGWEPHFDSKGNLMTAFMDKDVNKDGVIDKLDIASYDDLAGHTEMFKFDNAYDRAKLLEEDIKTIETPVNGIDNGTKKTVTTGFKDIDKTTGVPYTILERATNRLYNQDGTATDILRDIAYTSNTPLTIKDEKGVEVSNTKGLSELVTNYAKDVYAGMKKGVVTDVNLEREKMNQAESHFQQTRQDKKAKGNNSEEFLGSNNFTKPAIAIAKNGSDSKGLVIADKVVEGIKGSKVYSLKGTNLTRKIGEKGANEIVENIYVLPSGELALKGYKVDGTVGEGANKSSNTTDFFYRTKSGDAEAGAVLDFISKKKNPNTNDYYKSIDEFKEVVTGGKPKNAPKKQESNTIKSGYTEGGYRFKGGNANDPKNWEKI